MTHGQILDYCLQKPGAYLDYPFDPVTPVVKVRAPSQEKGHIFAQAFFLRGEPKATFNCTPLTALIYRDRYPGAVTRGWHCPAVQQPHFNTVSLDGAVPDAEIYEMIDHAYDVVVGKMPKYLQKELRGAGYDEIHP